MEEEPEFLKFVKKTSTLKVGKWLGPSPGFHTFTLNPSQDKLSWVSFDGILWLEGKKKKPPHFRIHVLLPGSVCSEA